MDEQVKVSIICNVYNHVKYLNKCLDGFVMQKTNFKFEVLIHDDASTDGSQDIIREYEEKYPDIIKPIYQKENQYSKHIGINKTYQYPRVKGKYIAFCEGDDYWCDENKLQLQYDAMETTPDASACVCRVQEVTEDGRLKNRFYPQGDLQTVVLNTGEFLSLNLQENNYPFQTSSYLCRKSVVDLRIMENPKFCVASNVGDVPLLLFCSAKGKIVYIDNTMSYYRTGAVGSWNSRQTKSSLIENYRSEIAMYSLFDIYTNLNYSDVINQLLNREYYYYYYYLLHDYRKLLRKEYRTFLKKEPIKQRAYIFISAFFPKLMTLYNRLKFSGANNEL